MIGITGSNGKTTTAHIIEKMVQTDEIHGLLAGNVGIPFSRLVLNDLNNPNAKRLWVLEISSFQMEFIIHFRPFISIFLNIKRLSAKENPITPIKIVTIQSTTK